MARTTPADSWPRICVSVTTMGPMRPACQKWMSDLLFELDMSQGSVQEEAAVMEYEMTYPHIPVLLIPTVTSPSFKSCPFLTLSSVGPDSATQSLCSGSVKTPTLGKLIVSVTVAMVALF